MKKISKTLQENFEGWHDFVLDGEMMTYENNFGSVSGLGHSKSIFISFPVNYSVTNKDINVATMKYFVFDILKLDDYLDKGSITQKINSFIFSF